MRELVALLLVVALAPAAPVPKALKKASDAELVLGRWKPVGGSTQWYEFKGDGTLLTWNTGSEKSPAAYRWTLDPTASPKRITWYGVESKQPEWEGVYELNGDSLRVAYSAVPKVPTGFGPGEAAVVLEQVRDTSAK